VIMGHINDRLAVVLASPLALFAPAVANAQSAPQPDAPPEPQPDAAPEPQPDAPPEPQPDASPEPQPDASPEPQPDAPPEQIEVMSGSQIYDIGSTAQVLTIGAPISPRSQATSSMLMPKGSLTVGADLSFLTADAGVGDGQIRFTDVVLFRPRAPSSRASRTSSCGRAAMSAR
jgi:hypothetical protein